MTRVDLVDVVTQDGLMLAGALGWPLSASASNRSGADAVLLIHGNGSNFHSPYQKDFLGRSMQAGLTALAANTRGHGMLSVALRPGQPGMGYVGTSVEWMNECVADLEAWLKLLQTKGFRRIVLWGHSRGAVKVAYFMAHAAPAEVSHVVLSSPPLLSYERWMRSDRAQEFTAILRSCQEQVNAGAPDALVPVTLPLSYLSGASQYLDTYGEQEKYNVLRLAQRIERPTLAITGTVEAQTLFPFIGLPAMLDELAQRRDSFTHLSVPGGDHVYTGQREWVMHRVLDWLG